MEGGKRKRPIAARLGSILLVLWVSLAAYLPHALAAKDELQIGLPDFPRRIERTLPPLRPEQEIRLGIFKLHPSFFSSIEYDDNILLSHKDEKEDVIFTQTPGLGMELNLGDHRFQAGYGMEIENFAKFEEENAVNHLANAVLELNFTDLQIKFQDVFEKATSRSFSETSARDDLLTNTFEILGRYDRPRWAGELGWRHNTLDHRKEDLDIDDLEEDVLAILGGYKFLPKTLFLLEMDLGVVTYRNTGNANHDYWQILTGLRGDPLPKVATTAKIGFQGRQLGDVPGSGPQTDFEGLVANMDLTYGFTERDTMRIAYVRTIRNSTFAENGWYRQDKISITYAKRFLNKWVVTPEFGWQMNDYPESATVGTSVKVRQDNYWLGGVSLRYEIKQWLGMEVAYHHRHRDSNFDSLDFKNNRLNIELKLAY